MSGDDKQPQPIFSTSMNLTRRHILQAAMAGGVTVSFGRSACATDVTADKFMIASKLLIQHNLSADVGARMLAILNKTNASLDSDLDQIIAAAKTKNARTVEDFFSTLEGTPKQTALQIIHGWYMGVVDDTATAEVFAYEKALMFQTTKDAVATPTYVFSGPNNWANINPPLSAMPEF